MFTVNRISVFLCVSFYWNIQNRIFKSTNILYKNITRDSKEENNKITNEIDRLLNRQLLDLSFCCNCSFVRSVLRFSSIFIYLSLRKFIRNLHQSYVRKRKKNQQQHKPTNDIIISCFSFFVGEGKKYIESTRRQQRKLKK